jgi:hypothetical protein
MELNRNQYFMIGLVLLFLGLQFKFVDSYVLTDDAAKFVAKRLGKDPGSQNSGVVANTFASAASMSPSAQSRTVEPPTWLGWALMSVGGVLILHSLAMGKP